MKRVLLGLTALICFCGAKAQIWNEMGTGMNNTVYAIAADTANGMVYASGKFTDAGGVSVNRIAKWDGTNWTDVGGGFNNNVNALCFSNGILYAAGDFTSAGGSPVNYIAQWNGTSWTSVGTGLDGSALVLVSDNAGGLYAGGYFLTAGGQNVNRIAHWNGITWSALSSGIGIAGEFVETIHNYNGNIYAGGKFTTAGAVPANSIAFYDGISWNALGTGVTGSQGRVIGLESFNGNLIVCGSFTNAGGILADAIASWNGTTWSALNGGIAGGSIKPTSLEVLYNELYIGGSFTTAGGVPVSNIARWNGVNWNALGNGVDNQVDFLHSFNGDIYVGGQFVFADTITANRIAKYKPSCNTLISKSPVNNTCFQSCNGSAAIISSGLGPFSYLWSTSDTGSSINSLCAGIYYITVTNAYGCSVTDSIIITEPLPLTDSMNFSNPVCALQCNGAATANVYNPQGNVTYSWNTIPPQTSQTATALCSGIYTVVITDSAGCSVTDSVALVDPLPNSASINPFQPTCFGGCNGFAVAISNGIAPFSYSWNTAPSQSTDTAFNLCAGVYDVTVTDSIGCTAFASIIISEPAPDSLFFVTTEPICNSACNGTATVTSNGPAPYTYIWQTMPNQTLQTAFGLCAGIYSVIVTDSLGCTATDSIQVTEPLPNVASFSYTPVECATACNGTATAFSTGTSPFTYLWSTADTTQTINNLCTGSYIVTVTDSLGCTSDTTIIIDISAPLPIIFSLQPSGCNSECTGTASAMLQGGIAVSYFWSAGDSTQMIDSLCAGPYYITIVDTLGCSFTDTTQIVPATFSLNYSISTPICAGQCNASINITPSGMPPYNILWATGDTTFMIDSLCAGIYPVTVTDSINCESIDSIVVADPPDITYSFSVINPKCPGFCDGEITVNAQGNGSLTYLWNTVPPQSDTTASNLCQGYTAVTISDVNGCQKTDSALIVEPPPIIIQKNILDVSCNGVCDGFIGLNVFGGTPGYTYVWSNGFTIPNLLNLCPGTYTITVTDFNNCVQIDSATVNQPQPIAISFAITNVSCQGCTDGSATGSVTGGTLPYDYLWLGIGDTDSIITNVGAGTYTLCISDFNNCIFCDTVVITEPNAIANYSRQELNVSVYPNPAKDICYIKLTGTLNNEAVIQMTDISGRRVNLNSVTGVSENERLIRINTSLLPAGIYFVNIVQSGAGHVTAKIMVRH